MSSSFEELMKVLVVVAVEVLPLLPRSSDLDAFFAELNRAKNRDWNRSRFLVASRLLISENSLCPMSKPGPPLKNSRLTSQSLAI